jgi:cellulose synthase/poly-beta-1,6-N-acetylglucosamine synthase-like glycosyltransferase
MREPVDGNGLDAVRDVDDWSYKVIGILAWSTLLMSAVGVLIDPHILLWVARLFAFYLLARLILNLGGYIVGLDRCRRAARRVASAPASPPSGIHHVVVIPNYREPFEILRRTLDRLSRHAGARQCLTVVLGMEEREEGAHEKAEILRRLYGEAFAHMLVTFHPAGLPGELAGKGSNLAWAVRAARRTLVNELGVPLDDVVLTICDADSLLHPGYLGELARAFLADPDRHRRFWHAPLFATNNVWSVPALLRLLLFSSGSVRLGELVNPLAWSLPVSTYSLSLRLADEAGYWDPFVISEDWHMYLRCFFATGGRVRLQVVYLPTTIDAPTGATLREAMKNLYQQQKRHSWGAEDVGYILQQWRRSPAVDWRAKLVALSWVLHHHLLRSTSWFILAFGTLASRVVGEPLVITLPNPSADLSTVRFVNALGGLGGVAMWAVERSRWLPDGDRWVTDLVREVIAWVALPMLVLAFSTLPGLHAQTQMMFGHWLTYRRTTKGASRDGSRASGCAGGSLCDPVQGCAQGGTSRPDDENRQPTRRT